jgi:hypothetical protein
MIVYMMQLNIDNSRKNHVSYLLSMDNHKTRNVLMIYGVE